MQGIYRLGLGRRLLHGPKEPLRPLLERHTIHRHQKPCPPFTPAPPGVDARRLLCWCCGCGASALGASRLSPESSLEGAAFPLGCKRRAPAAACLRIDRKLNRRVESPGTWYIAFVRAYQSSKRAQQSPVKHTAGPKRAAPAPPRAGER